MSEAQQHPGFEANEQNISRNWRATGGNRIAAGATGATHATDSTVAEPLPHCRTLFPDDHCFTDGQLRTAFSKNYAARSI